MFSLSVVKLLHSNNLTMLPYNLFLPFINLYIYIYIFNTTFLMSNINWQTNDNDNDNEISFI